MSDLIARLKAASDGSEVLDNAIADAVLVYVDDMQVVGAPFAERTYRHPDGSVGTALRYTRSLDAALSLVPQGWLLEELNQARPPFGWYAKVGAMRGFDRAVAEGATGPLALCIAALKARKPE